MAGFNSLNLYATAPKAPTPAPAAAPAKAAEPVAAPVMAAAPGKMDIPILDGPHGLAATVVGAIEKGAALASSAASGGFAGLAGMGEALAGIASWSAVGGAGGQSNSLGIASAPAQVATNEVHAAHFEIAAPTFGVVPQRSAGFGVSA